MPVGDEQERRARAKAFQTAAKWNERRKRGQCLHPEASSASCAGDVTAAHTVQRNGGLKAIADTSHHVLTVIPSMREMMRTGGKPEPTRVGIGLASTFPGFCNVHDSIFAPIEQERLSPSAEAAFLFAYRSVSLEVFRKRDELAAVADMKNAAQDAASPQGKAAAHQVLRLYEVGVRRGLSDVNRIKASYDILLLSQQRPDFHWAYIEFAGLLPVVSSGAFLPDYDYKSERLQNLADFLINARELTLNVTSFEGRSVVVFGWQGRPGNAAERFVKSFLEDVPEEHKANAAICLTFEFCENTYMSEPWWSGLTDTQRQAMKRRMVRGTPNAQRTRHDVRDYGRSYSQLVPLRTVTGF